MIFRLPNLTAETCITPSAHEAYAIAGVPYNKKGNVIIALNTLAPEIEAELKSVSPN